MSEWLKGLFVTIFGKNSWLATLIISMIPAIELRGAIPFGSAKALWGENALSLPMSFLFSILGSSIITIILTFAFLPFFRWLKSTKSFKNFANKIEKKLNKNSASINEKTENESDNKKILKLKFWGIFGFVALPLPLTGVWTGTCLALFIGLNKAQTLLSVLPGNVIAGILMTLISYFFADNTIIVLYAFLILIAIVVVFGIIKKLIDNKKIKNQNKDEQIESETENIEKTL